MQYKNGIPVDLPHKRRRQSDLKGKQLMQNDYTKYKQFATLKKTDYSGNERHVWAMVPTGHPDFKELKQSGFKVIEVWEKRSKEVTT